MKVVFYDRKNLREVTNTELISINLTQERLVDPDGYCTVDTIGTLGYKSKYCPSYKNWDLWCNLVDLVVLRIEDEV